MGIYHVPLPVEYFPAFSFCSDCCVWGALSVGWKFVVPLYCEACSLWVGLVACQDLLVKEAFVSVLMGGAGSLLSGVQ